MEFLQPCHNLATTLSQPCSIFTIPLQPCSHIVYSFTRLSQACHNLATTLSRPCSIFTIPLQPCSHIVYNPSQACQPCHNLATTLYYIHNSTATLQPHCLFIHKLPPPHYNDAIISQAHYNLVTTMSGLSQAGHNLVTTL